MNESVVAGKTAEVLRHMILRLRERRRWDNEIRSGNVQLEGRSQDFTAGNSTLETVTPPVASDGMDVFSLGSEFWDGGMWNWGHDLGIGWEFEPDIDTS